VVLELPLKPLHRPPSRVHLELTPLAHFGGIILLLLLLVVVVIVVPPTPKPLRWGRGVRDVGVVAPPPSAPPSFFAHGREGRAARDAADDVDPAQHAPLREGGGGGGGG
jgi:hypothetical protein